MTARADRVCWVDEDWDRTNASDRVSRYGAYLRGHTELFDPWREATAGVTEDPGEFAIAALQVATGPIMSPGYVRWHARVLDYKLDRGLDPEPGRLVCSVTLATFPSLWLGSPWRGWTEYRSEEHTSELQSRVDLVCRLLLDKKKTSCYAPAPPDEARFRLWYRSSGLCACFFFL